MPRDLQDIWSEASEQILNEMPSLSEQPARDLSSPVDFERSPAMDASPVETHRIPSLKFYPKALTLQDVDACCILEDAAFPPEQRCTREKFIYRITVSPELCHGLFTTASEDYEPHHLTEALTASAAPRVESSSPRKLILLAHAIGTLSTNPTVLDTDMALPPKWNDPSHPKDPTLGHKSDGRTAMLHSLAVLPGYQGQRVGSTMLKGFIDVLRASGSYDRLALIADESHVHYYLQRGFKNLGPSKAAFGGVSWFDMVLDFQPNGDDDY